MAEFVSIPHH